MSYSLKISNGDLVAGTGVLMQVRGIEKLTQDLSLWLREPYSIDRFHPSYGSVLDRYIGSIISQLSEHEIRAEAIRVLSAYQQIQLAAVKANPSKYTADELLNTVNDVRISSSYDSVYVSVHFSTATGQSGQVQGNVSL